jgi:hypothetical protein
MKMNRSFTIYMYEEERQKDNVLLI